MSKKKVHAALSLIFLFVWIIITVRLVIEPGMISYLANFYSGQNIEQDNRLLNTWAGRAWLIAWFISLFISLFHTYSWLKEIRKDNRSYK